MVGHNDVRAITELDMICIESALLQLFDFLQKDKRINDNPWTDDAGSLLQHTAWQ